MTMAIGGLGGSSPYDQQTFGAAVVSETLDYMNDTSSGSSFAPVDKMSAEASLVSKTLDYMNSGSSSADKTGMAQSYDFQTSVLGAHAKGVVVDAII
ncbi:hypothetical protein SYK_01530 [Pseudodesulfovibrio nedwellii]|uniref:Uncharacterized protein n=1 Tax=Pseudodesulfovibrio nedwellii TaxID=2973072 RepID=A0ABN6S1J0_9BACT|nr:MULTISPECIES: hypothetical protein [Pseudodesulfovibrio]BDQ35793.1 hypothetical protein SYK_01530 [Pseudodesulfovibrio nedwellii]